MEINQILKILIIGFSALFFNSCSESGSNDNNNNAYNPNDVLMPLAVGNTWIGKVTFFDSKSNIVFEKFDTLRIDRSIVIDGITWYVSDASEHMFRNDASGFHDYVANTDIEIQHLKYPCNIGDRMVYDTVEIGERNQEPTKAIIGNQLSHKNFSIRVIAGVFSCYYYKTYATKLDGTILGIEPPFVPSAYYNPNIGLVKSETYDFNDPTNKSKVVWELVSYELH